MYSDATVISITIANLHQAAKTCAISKKWSALDLHKWKMNLLYGIVCLHHYLNTHFAQEFASYKPINTSLPLNKLDNFLWLDLIHLIWPLYCIWKGRFVGPDCQELIAGHACMPPANEINLKFSNGILLD